MLSSSSNISSSSNRSILFYIHSNSSREGYCSRSGAIPSLFLIFQGTETSDTRLDPVVLVAELDLGVGLGHQRGSEDRALGTGHLDPGDEVGRVAGRGQGAGASENLVHRAAVDVALGSGAVLLWEHVYAGHG